MNRKKVQIFNDGVLSIYKLTGKEEKLNPIFKNLRFEERIVGAERFFKAKEAQYNISRVIRIPQVKEICDKDIIGIEGEQFRILQVQSINDTFPKCWQLTLEKVKKRQLFDYEKN